MPYSDEEKQREANREAARRAREKRKGMTQGMTQEENVIPENVIPKKPLITLSDGQIFNPNIEVPFKIPEGKPWWPHAMAMCNRANEMRLEKTPEQKKAWERMWNDSHDEKGRWKPPTKEELDEMAS